jgi:hypothetical protein
MVECGSAEGRRALRWLRDDDEGFTNPKPMDDGEPASAIACTPDDALALVFVDALTDE